MKKNVIILCVVIVGCVVGLNARPQSNVNEKVETEIAEVFEESPTPSENNPTTPKNSQIKPDNSKKAPNDPSAESGIKRFREQVMQNQFSNPATNVGSVLGEIVVGSGFVSVQRKGRR